MEILDILIYVPMWENTRKTLLTMVKLPIEVQTSA